MKTRTNANTFRMVLTALMAALIMTAILFIRVPIPFTQGYVHLGDAMIFLSVLILGWKHGAVAAALGGMLGDILGGFAMWAPWTFAIKGIMAVILGLVVMSAAKKATDSKKFICGEIIGMIAAGAFMTVGYYVAEGIMYGSWAAPILGIPWNIGQFAVGMVLAVLLASALCKTPARAYFAYRLEEKQPVGTAGAGV